MNHKIVTVMLAFVVLFPGVSTANMGITGWFPNQYEFQCEDFERNGLLTSAAQRLELGENIYIYNSTYLSNNPETWYDLQSALSQTKDLLLESHGVHDVSYGISALILEPYADWNYALAAYDSYGAALGFDSFCLTSSNSVGLTALGIETLLEPYSDPDGLKLIFSCYSAFLKNAWGSFSPYGGGGSYYGYAIAVPNSIACSEYDNIVRVLSCEDHDWTGLENDIYSAYGYSNRIGVFSGNPDNAFNRYISCRSYDANFDAVGAWNGSFHWICTNEQRWSQYIIEGVDAIGDQPDTLAIVNGFGFDGSGVHRSYSVKVPQRSYLRVRELDNYFNVTSSDWTTWQEKPDDWFLESGKEITMGPMRVAADGRVVGIPVSSEKDFQIQPSDVVVYTTEDLSIEANRIRGSWQMTTSKSGNYFRARTWTGSEDPEEIRSLYRQIAQANQDYNANNQDSPYRQWPILQIVGDGNMVITEEDTIQMGPHQFVWEDGQYGGSGNGIWCSYSLMTDTDGDGIPNGPVVVLPMHDFVHAQIHADAVEHWNSNGPMGNEVLLCLDDTYGGVSSPWLESKMFNEFETSYVNPQGMRLKAVMKESDYLPTDNWVETRNQMIEDGTSMINSGVAEVWYTGLAAGPRTHTYFLEGVNEWTRPQEFLLYGPTCQFGDMYSGTGHQIMKEMFNTTGGIVVGGIGQLSAAYYPQHRILSLLMQEMIPQMPDGTLLTDAAFQIQQEFLQRYPEFYEYGLGIHCVGSIAKMLRSPLSPVQDDELVLINDFNLRSIASGSSGGLKFNLPKRSQVNLKVYDLKGRLISTILDESMSQGSHHATFNTNRLASGVYFARLQVGNRSESIKITIVK